MNTDQITVATVGSPEWVANRRRGLGASDIGSAIGVSPWKSRFELWQEKTGRVAPKKPTRRMLVGSALEPLILDAWAEDNNATVIATQSTHKIDASCPMWATLDAIATMPDGSTVAVETKSTTWKNKGLGEQDTDDIPLYWQCQAHAQLQASGLDVCYFAVWVDEESREFVVRRDDRLWSGILAKCEEFWAYVKSDTTPPLGWADTDEYVEVIGLRPMRETPEDVTDTDITFLWAEYKRLGEAISSQQKFRDSIKAEILSKLPDRNVIIGDQELYVREVNRKGYTVEPSTCFQLASRRLK